MGSSGQTCRTEAGFRKGSKYTSTGPCSSARQMGCGAPENTGLTYTRLVSSRAEPKATRSAESWLPLMANTGRPRAASWVRNQSSRRTASAGGTGLSYRSPASSTPSTGWASSRARICSRMYFWSSSMENSHTRLPRCRSERCAKRKSEHRLSDDFYPIIEQRRFLSQRDGNKRLPKKTPSVIAGAMPAPSEMGPLTKPERFPLCQRLPL